MFQQLKSKTKAPSLRIRSRSVDSKGSGPAAKTFSMASMPLIPQTESTAVLAETGPRIIYHWETVHTQVPQPHLPKDH